jgi:hypothetical protein
MPTTMGTSGLYGLESARAAVFVGMHAVPDAGVPLIGAVSEQPAPRKHRASNREIVTEAFEASANGPATSPASSPKT